jgi:tetratricopeptide (TPR) repeat protein
MKGASRVSKQISYSALKLLEHEFQVAWGSRDLQKCLDLLGKVLVLNPRSANALLQLGRVHGMIYEYDHAVDALEKAVQVSPKEQRALVLTEAGRTARDFYDPTIAESFFSQAVEAAGLVKGKHAAGDAIEAKLALAEYAIRIRNRDLSKVLVDEVLGTHPEDKAASLLWCKLNEDQFDHCVERLQLLQQVDSVELKVKAGYQLAKLLDREGDYDAAMQALIGAKSCIISARDPIVTHRLRIRAQLNEFAEDFTKTKHAEWRDVLRDLGESKNLVLLGGHPRSGTTLLEQVLDSHPGAVSAEESENLSSFFYCPAMRKHGLFSNIARAMDSCSVDELREYRSKYFEAMERCVQQDVGSKVLVDKNPSLTPLSPAFFRLYPETKFVTMVRDPRDVVVSCFMQPFFPPDVISGNFLTLVDTAEEVNFLMANWANIRGRFDGNVCEIRYEELVEDIGSNARKVIDFIGLEWNDLVMDYDQHAREKVVRSPTADAVTEKVHVRAKARWKHYEKHLGPIFEKLSDSLSAFGYE